MERLGDDELLQLTPRRPEAFAVFYRRHEQTLIARPAPRPARFDYHGASPVMLGMVKGCIPGAAVPSVETFGLSGRAFTSIVVLGAHATPTVRSQALEILDRLRAAAPAAPAAARGSG